MENDMSKWILPLATAVGAWGGFPQAPKVFKDLVSDNEIVRYAMVFILVWQGGGGQNAQVALITTALVFLATKLLEMKALCAPMMIVAAPAPPAPAPAPPVMAPPPQPEMEEEEMPMTEEEMVENYWNGGYYR